MGVVWVIVVVVVVVVVVLHASTHCHSAIGTVFVTLVVLL
jgi:hypothetical protein